MNSKDLKEKLAAQRGWREQKTSLQKPKRWKPGFALLSVIIVVASTLIVLSIVYVAYVLTPKETSAAIMFTEVPHAGAYIIASATPTLAPITMKVCAENLHVRFTPNGSVRGYLKDGEQVTLAVDAHGRLITKEQDHEIWIWVATPVEGWANKKFLCK